MDRDPGDIASGENTVPTRADADARLDALLVALPVPPGILPADDFGEEDYREAMDDIAAGRGVSHSEVAKWLSTWGSPDFKPMPDEWLK